MNIDITKIQQQDGNTFTADFTLDSGVIINSLLTVVFQSDPGKSFTDVKADALAAAQAAMSA